MKRNFKESLYFVIQYSPELFIFNGNPWHTLVIKNNIITEFERFRLTDKYSLYFFKINDITSVLFDKFFQGHYWGITNEHRRTTIPQLIAKKYPMHFFVSFHLVSLHFMFTFIGNLINFLSF